jgi:dipeptidyl aminopeptidase/acylaminoacyl peptidase
MLPTVIKVHGGPEARDRWGFDPWVQFFANRRYLCVQVNYRGSIGYGKKFMAAARKEWGRAMHHDVVDAIRWVIDQGFADPDRIAMWGTSYGGYETLWCVATELELLACAIAGMAPVNLLTFMDDLPSYWVHVRAMYKHRLGDPDADAEMLRERSPLTHAHDIRRPMLAFYGDHDPRVRINEAEQLAKVLESAGVPNELHVLKDEGHFVTALSEGALDFMAARTESFLASHLGGRAEP